MTGVCFTNHESQSDRFNQGRFTTGTPPPKAMQHYEGPVRGGSAFCCFCICQLIILSWPFHSRQLQARIKSFFAPVVLVCGRLKFASPFVLGCYNGRSADSILHSG